MGSEPEPRTESVFDLDLSLFNRKFEHGCLDIECRSCAERTDDPVLERVREVFITRTDDPALKEIREAFWRSLGEGRF